MVADISTPALSTLATSYRFVHSRKFHQPVLVQVGGVAQLVERRSLAGELSLSYARPAADG